MDMSCFHLFSIVNNTMTLCLCSCMRAKSLQSCPTLCTCTDCSPPGFFVHGVLQARILEWVAITSSRGSSWRRDRTWVSCVAGILYCWATGEAPLWTKIYKYLFASLPSVNLGVELLVGSMFNTLCSMFNLLRNHQTFPQWLHHFTFPPGMPKGSNFLTSLPVLVIFH